MLIYPDVNQWATFTCILEAGMLLDCQKYFYKQQVELSFQYIKLKISG